MIIQVAVLSGVVAVASSKFKTYSLLPTVYSYYELREMLGSASLSALQDCMMTLKSYEALITSQVYRSLGTHIWDSIVTVYTPTRLILNVLSIVKSLVLALCVTNGGKLTNVTVSVKLQ